AVSAPSPRNRWLCAGDDTYSRFRRRDAQRRCGAVQPHVGAGHSAASRAIPVAAPALQHPARWPAQALTCVGRRMTAAMNAPCGWLLTDDKPDLGNQLHGLADQLSAFNVD